MDKGFLAVIIFDFFFFGGLWLIFKIGEIGERRPEKKIK